MKELREIVICTTPFMVAALLLYPFIAFIGGDPDPFLWERTDRLFYFICIVAFGFGLLHRLQYVAKWEK